MSQSNIIEKKEEKGFDNEVQTIFYRVPKKNHDTMVELSKPFTDLFRKHGVLHWDIFQLSSTENVMEFTNIAKTLSASQDEEVWVEIFYYKDKKHKDEVIAKMMTDKVCEQSYQLFMNLITPGSTVINGDFSHIDGISFV
jgi:uncharacterized protein YbaA (DUF1428 family)